MSAWIPMLNKRKAEEPQEELEQDILHHENDSDTAYITKLPDTVLALILEYLDPVDVGRFLYSSKHFHAVGKKILENRQLLEQERMAQQQNNPTDDPEDKKAKRYRKLFVCRLPEDTTSSMLKNYFQRWGFIQDAIVFVNRKINTYGYITFTKNRSLEQVQAARPHKMKGVEIITKRATPQINIYGQKTAADTTNKILVRGLQKEIKEEDLWEYFKFFGPIVSCVVKKPDENHKQKYGFVEFYDYDTVDKIYLKRNHKIRNIRVIVTKAETMGELWAPEGVHFSRAKTKEKEKLAKRQRLEENSSNPSPPAT